MGVPIYMQAVTLNAGLTLTSSNTLRLTLGLL
jgi:hypothetical protein